MNAITNAFLNTLISPFSAELLLATPINHDVLLNGEKKARIKQLPPTITAKYHFKN
ncbi:OmpW family outer membrane protein, partial [Acinetobacter baumannii]|uniref:OmpW family outer membrane protein n=1 Tax=Acinetobacter baumannii TaxID=470 RepID=UPI00294B950A